VRLPVISTETIRGGAVADQPLELKEYEFYIGHVKTTGMLTKEMADSLGATEVGASTPPAEDQPVANTNAQRLSSQNAAGDESGVVSDNPDALNKARTARNRRSQ
jgi:hypothetical protein